MVTLLSRVDILPANEEENVTEVLFTSVMLAAKEELSAVKLLCKLSNLVAMEELLVVNVLFTVLIEESSEAEVFTKDELSSVNCSVNDALVVVKALLTSVMLAAKDALSKDPVPACAAAIVSILPAKDDDAFTNVVFAVDIEAARDELFVVIELESVSSFSAADELLLVIVVDSEFIVETSEDDPA